MLSLDNKQSGGAGQIFRVGSHPIENEEGDEEEGQADMVLDCRGTGAGYAFGSFWLRLRSVSSVLRADRNTQTFASGQRALDPVGGQESFTLQFERERDVKQVEAPAAKPLGVPG